MLHIKLGVCGISKMALKNQYLPFAFSSSALRWRAGTLQTQRLGNRWRGYKNKYVAVVIGSGQRESFTGREHLIFAYLLASRFSTQPLQIAFRGARLRNDSGCLVA